RVSICTFCIVVCCFFFQAEDGIRDRNVTGVQTCALPISPTCELAVTVSPLLTLTLTLILTLRLNIGLRRLIFIPVDELVAGVAVMLILGPHAGPHEFVRVALCAAPLLDHERGHEAVCEVVRGPCASDGPQPAKDRQ